MLNGKIMNNDKNRSFMQEKAADSLDSARRKPRARNTRTHKNGPKKSHNYASTQHTALCYAMLVTLGLFHRCSAAGCPPVPTEQISVICVCLGNYY